MRHRPRETETKADYIEFCAEDEGKIGGRRTGAAGRCGGGGIFVRWGLFAMGLVCLFPLIESFVFTPVDRLECEDLPFRTSLRILLS